MWRQRSLGFPFLQKGGATPPPLPLSSQLLPHPLCPGSGPSVAPGAGHGISSLPEVARRLCARPGLLLLRLGRRDCSQPGVAMTNELDIFVGNTTLIDEDVYRLWLDGYSGLWGDRLGEAVRPSGCFGWVKERSLDLGIS